jgi:hypothetical protein
MAKAAVALLLELCPGCLCAGGGAEEGVLQEELPAGGGHRAEGGVGARRRQPGARRQVPPHVLPRLLRQGARSAPK